MESKICTPRSRLALAHAGNFQDHEDYNEGTSDDVIEITDLEDVLADATSDNAEVIPTNGGKKTKASEELSSVITSPPNLRNIKIPSL
ncbi:unnamed protein product [Rhizophagus irregularis]|nr:unnamed protein product [Rhizophagus irregularis]